MAHQPPPGPQAFAHPLRLRIVEIVAANGSASPSEMADELDAPLGNVSYHVRQLADAGILKLARSTPRRGAIERHYKLGPQAAAAATALEDLAERLRESLSIERGLMYAAHVGGAQASPWTLDAHGALAHARDEVEDRKSDEPVTVLVTELDTDLLERADMLAAAHG